MTIELAIEYIPRRMKSLGYNNDYDIKFRHFVFYGEFNGHLFDVLLMIKHYK